MKYSRLLRLRLLCLVVVLGFSHVSVAASDAPAINLPAVNGNLDLSKLRGKVVYLDFWASWCQPCKKSFPWLSNLKEKYAHQGLEVVAVNLDKDKSLADDFLTEFDINFIVAFDDSGKSAEDYNLRGMPSSFLIDRDGKLHASHVGFREKDTDKLEAAVQKLLDTQQASLTINN